MRLIISAIGLLKKGPESELVADYLKRLRGQAKQIGISQIDILEAKERTGGDDKKTLKLNFSSHKYQVIGNSSRLTSMVDI